MGWYGGFTPYVSVAERKRKAARKIVELKKKGQIVEPVVVEGRTIVSTFWGKAWCNHLGSYSDYENRLPRGRTYVRNGSVIDLKVNRGEINALVSGSSIYKVKISIMACAVSKWAKIAQACSGKIDSLIELLQGKFSKGVMEIITHQEKGLFPHPKEIKFNCSCPDWADMCKHVAAVLYGIGSRLDARPEELFLLRQVDHSELIAKASKTPWNKTSKARSQILSDSDLSTLFDIDIESTPHSRRIQKKLIDKKTPSLEKKLSPSKATKDNSPAKPKILNKKQSMQEKPAKGRASAVVLKNKKLQSTSKSKVIVAVNQKLASSKKIDKQSTPKKPRA
jgi:uncharacterized Zn finger protein